MQKLVQTSYFKYFKINFDKQCKFWSEEHFCSTENCAVEILPAHEYNWEEVVLNDLKPSNLGKLNKQQDNDIDYSVESCEDLDYCELDDDNNCDYISLVDNPERFTGYGGDQAHTVWNAIYHENCFCGGPEHAESCARKMLFGRIVSGMHTSISTHLAYEYLCPDTDDIEDFKPNLKVFMERVGNYNDRISNLYFNYALISQAVSRMLGNYPVIDFIKQSDNLVNNEDDYSKLINGVESAINQETIFDGSLLAVDQELKHDFRMKFRNISSIMDCVGCDRCRMWGKLQTIGYGTALKVLFEDKNQNLKFRRIEIVSLINTFDRLSKSIEAIKYFKQKYADHLRDVELGKVQPGDYDKWEAVNGVGFPFLESSNTMKNRMKERKDKKKETESKESNDSKQTQSTDSKSTELKHKRTLKEEFAKTIGEVVEALMFVLKSYKDVPLFFLKYGIIKLNYLWNVFLGLDPQDYYEEVRLGEQEYINLFS